MKKSVCIVLCICFFTMSIAALELGDVQYEVTSSRTEDGQKIYEGVDGYGNELTLIGTENLTDTSRKALQIMLSTFNNWKNLVIGSQRVVITKDRTEMALIPETFVYNGTDLAEFMPSGMQFYYTTFLEYDFRMYKDKLFLRLTGQIFDEQQFCEKLANAIENPVLYIQTHNPDYLIEQIGLISTELEAIKAEVFSFREEYDALVEDYKTLESDYQALTGDYKSFKEEYSELETSHEELTEEYNLLRDAVVAFANKGLFQLLSPMESERVAAVVKAKMQNSDITSKELAAQLKEQGVDVSPKEVAIIFAVYFNDFEQ